MANGQVGVRAESVYGVVMGYVIGEGVSLQGLDCAKPCKVQEVWGAKQFFQRLGSMFPSLLFISWCCCDKRPQTSCFRAAETYCLIVPKTKSLKSVSSGRSQGVRGPCSLQRLCGEAVLASSSFWELLAFFNLWSHHSHLCLCGHVAVFSSVSNLLPVSSLSGYS